MRSQSSGCKLSLVLLSLLRLNNTVVSSQIKLTAQEEVALELRASQVEYGSVGFYLYPF